MNTFTRRLAAVAVTGVLTVTTFATTVGTASASEDVGIMGCSATAPDKDGSSYRKTFGNGVNIRKGRSTSCTALGKGYTSQKADYHCWSAYGGHTWTYLRNVSTGVKGWVRDDMLTDGGSNVWCGF